MRVFIYFHSVAGLDKIEFLQSHENREIYQKAFSIIERYFGTEEEDKSIAPQTDENAQQFQFSAGQDVPMEGFQFWADFFLLEFEPVNKQNAPNIWWQPTLYVLPWLFYCARGMQWWSAISPCYWRRNCTDDIDSSTWLLLSPI